MIGAISAVCDLPVTTAVICPTVRIHPAIIAQAAATSAVLLGEGRFRLGIGSGEALNEHILGDPWPRAATRLEMLEEAVEVIRLLWRGQDVSHDGHAGNDPVKHVEAFTPYVDAGFDEVYVANMGPHYADMLRTYGESVLPALRSG